MGSPATSSFPAEPQPASPKASAPRSRVSPKGVPGQPPSNNWLDAVQVTSTPSPSSPISLASPKTAFYGRENLLDGALESVDLSDPRSPKSPFYSSRMAWQLVDASDDQ